MKLSRPADDTGDRFPYAGPFGPLQEVPVISPDTRAIIAMQLLVLAFVIALHLGKVPLP